MDKLEDLRMKSLEKPPVIVWESEFPGLVEILEFLENPERKSALEKYNREYVYWDKFKHMPLPDIDDLTLEKLWSILTYKRNISSIPVTFKEYKFKYVLTNQISKKLHEFDMKFGGNIDFDQEQLLQDGEKQRYLISSLMEEAIASSQIEGAVTTRKKAKEMLRKNMAPRNLSEQMIANNYATIKKLSELKDKKLSPKILLQIHRDITFSTLDNSDDEGRFRINDEVDVVDAVDNEIVYTPPTYTEIPELILSLCDYFNNDDDEVYTHPIIKGCIIHFMVGWIHPFADGNGRTARALFYWYLLKRGYWLIEYMSISRLIIKSKVQYANAYLYTETDRNDLTYFINYKVKMLHLAFESLVHYLKQKAKERKQIKTIVTSLHINDRQAEIIRMLRENPHSYLTVKELVTIFSVADQTIRNDIKVLLDKRIIAEVKIDKKSTVYTTGRNFDTLSW